MAKRFIDVPVVGYQTWMIISGYRDENGDFVENDNSDFMDSLERQYPYNEKNPHVR